MTWNLLETFAADLETAADDEAAWAVTQRHAAALGFDTLCYFFFPGPDEEAVALSSYDPRWMTRYAEEGYADKDIATAETLRRRFRPLAFSSERYSKNFEMDRAHRKVFVEARYDAGAENIYSHTLFHDGEGCGAMGFVNSDMSETEFEQTVERSGTLMSVMIHMAHARLSESMRARGRPAAPELSGRQKDVLALLAQGAHYKQIADRLGISDNTVAYHTAELRRKFGCRTTRQVIQESYRLRLLGSA